MRYFECAADKRVYTEDQLKTLFVFKKLHMDMINHLMIGLMKN